MPYSGTHTPKRPLQALLRPPGSWPWRVEFFQSSLPLLCDLPLHRCLILLPHPGKQTVLRAQFVLCAGFFNFPILHHIDAVGVGYGGKAVCDHQHGFALGKLGKKIMDAYQGIEDKFADKFLEEDGSLKTGGMAKKQPQPTIRSKIPWSAVIRRWKMPSWMHSLRKWMNRNPRILRKKSNAKQRTAGTAQMYLPFSFIFKIIETQRQ